jgi:hypothetical protein
LRRNENQICREQSRARELAVGGGAQADSGCDATAPVPHTSQIVGDTTVAALAANDGSVCFPGTSWVMLPPSDWQQARALPAEGIEQCVPQQGASIAANACGILQPTLAYSASTSTNNARIPFFTKIKLILYAAAGNKEAGVGNGPSARPARPENALSFRERCLRARIFMAEGSIGAIPKAVEGTAGHQPRI